MKIQPLIIGHRGSRTFFRENTLESFQKAMDWGADMIELDILRTTDGALVIFHNDSIDGIALKET